MHSFLPRLLPSSEGLLTKVLVMFYPTDSLVDIVHCQIHLMYLALRSKNGTLACMPREKPSLGRNIAHCHPFTIEGQPTLWPCSLTPKYHPFFFSLWFLPRTTCLPQSPYQVPLTAEKPFVKCSLLWRCLILREPHLLPWSDSSDLYAHKHPNLCSNKIVVCC